jgi:hypothetical protein
MPCEPSSDGATALFRKMKPSDHVGQVLWPANCGVRASALPPGFRPARRPEGRWQPARAAPLFFLLLFPILASAQIICALGPNASSYKPASDQRPSADAMQLAGRVNAALKTICAANCPQTALFRNSTASNAMLVAAAGQAKLVYAPQFFSAAYDALGDGAIVGLIAHELGHALDDTLGAAWVKSDWPPELRADAWAGCTLARVDLSAGDLQAGLSALAKYPPPSSLDWKQRLPVLRTGFTQCGGNGARFESAVPRAEPRH